MPALQNDPDICEGLFSLDEKLTIQHVPFVAERLRDFLTRYQTPSRGAHAQPIEWPTFNDAARSDGPVFRDGKGGRERTPVPAFMRRPEGDVDTPCPRHQRRIVQYIMRSERWGDGGVDAGGTAVWGLSKLHPGDAITRRLGA